MLFLPPLLPCVERREVGYLCHLLQVVNLSTCPSGVFWALRCQGKSAENLIPMPAENLLHSYDKICTKLAGRNLRTALVRVSAVILFSCFGMTNFSFYKHRALYTNK